jgi:2Fe-2S iron-sulfur cluster binding domain
MPDNNFCHDRASIPDGHTGRRHLAAPVAAAGSCARVCGEFLLLQIKIDGVEHDTVADPQTPLLGAIRDIVGLTGTKLRCGVGACGSCTVRIDGQAVRSSLTTLANARGPTSKS